MKKNTANIKGDKNTVIQDTSKANINTGKGKNKKKMDTYQIIGIMIAIVTLITTIIIGWDKILNFFGA